MAGNLKTDGFIIPEMDDKMTVDEKLRLLYETLSSFIEQTIFTFGGDGGQ